MPEIVYKPNKKQRMFHLDLESQQLLMLGGKGSGKTHSLVMKAIQLAGENPGVDGGILCPSLKMFKRDFWPTLRRICSDNRIKYYYNKADSVVHFFSTDNVAYVYHSEDDGESIAGANLGWAVINEVTLCSKGAHAELTSRCRDKRARINQIAMSGTPEQFEWVYDDLIQSGLAKTIYTSTYDNKENVSDNYIKMLESVYDETMQRAYIHGEVVLFRGKRVAHSFSRDRHLKQFTGNYKDYQLWVSMDFNVDPMTATIWARMPVTEGLKLWAFDEIILSNSNTQEMGNVLKEKYGLDLTIYPDPAGNNRSTQSIYSDIIHLENMGFKKVKCRKKIESVRGCMIAVNNLFDKDEILIDPKCKNLIRDLDQVVWKDDSTTFDKSNPKLTHSLDGMKDMIDYEFPVMSNTKQVTIRKL